MDRKPRSWAQRDAQLNAMEAARGAAARRSQEKQEQARRDEANQSRVEFMGPRRPREFAEYEAKVFGPNGERGRGKRSYDEAEVRAWAEAEARFTKRGLVVYNWDTGEFEAEVQS